MEQQQWRNYAHGIWTTTIGQPSGLTPLALAGRVPLYQELERMSPAQLPFALGQVEFEQTDNAYIIRVPLAENERVYGLGLHFMRMNHRGRTRYLRVNSDPRQDTGETHAPVPFFVTDRGYGLLIDTSRIVTAFCGSTVRLKDNRLDQVKDRNMDRDWKATMQSEFMELSFAKNGAAIYAISGPTAMDAVRRYNLLCGGGTLPPKWGLGFWHRVPTMFTDHEVLDEAMEFRKRDFPCDVIGLEPGWHSESYPVTYEWDPARYPDPKRLVADLADGGFRVNLWENPYVSPKASLYKKLEPMSGSYTVWGGLAPDYALPEAQAVYKEQHLEQHVDIGVLGYKHDECDGSELTNHSWMFPAHAQFPSGHDGEQMRQLYGLMFQKMGDDLFRSRNRRTYGLVRASNAGASSMPYVLYSDLYDHKQFIRALCNSSFTGLLWTPEVRRAASAEDWVRRMQSVCLSPLAMLNAWGDGTKPWSYPEAAPIVRHYIKLRMRLLPYLYTAFAQYKFQGIPPFRAMPLVMNLSQDMQSNTITGAALNTTDGAYGKQSGNQWDDQFMVGDHLLVAPLFAGETSRKVLLPPGVWYGLETGERVEGGQVIQVDAPLNLLPIYVREGAVIPTIRALPHAPRAGERIPLHLIHFGDAPGELQLYDDDGETFDYENGQYCWLTGKVTRSANGTFSGELSRDVMDTMSYQKAKWSFGVTRLPEDESQPS